MSKTSVGSGKSFVFLLLIKGFGSMFLLFPCRLHHRELQIAICMFLLISYAVDSNCLGGSWTAAAHGKWHWRKEPGGS